MSGQVRSVEVEGRVAEDRAIAVTAERADGETDSPERLVAEGERFLAAMWLAGLFQDPEDHDDSSPESAR